MTRKEAIEELKAILEMQYWNVPLSKAALDMAIASLETDEAYQLEYERTTKNDLSSELEKNSQKLEKDFGELDCISREATINYFNNFRKKISNMPLMDVVDRLKEQPSVTPQEPRCKECKWWKDSDGEYRRGCGAESQCPINRKEVFEGNGYCYLFEPQESEDKE